MSLGPVLKMSQSCLTEESVRQLVRQSVISQLIN